jgi:hypothetical protein
MAFAQLPLAALQDVLEAIVPLIVMVMWAASQLLGNKPKAKPKPPARPQPPAVGNVVGQQAQGGKPPSLEETLRREVEEFMRRAQGRDPAKQGPQRPAALAGPGRPTPQRQEARQPRQPARTKVEPDRPRRLTDAPGGLTTPAAQETSRSAPLGSGVAQHVAQHLTGAQELAAHTRTLGADVALADDRMREHLQGTFVHKLGSLEHRVEEQRKVVRTPVAEAIYNSLKTPAGVRQIIVASEILRRPEERWSRSGDA